MTKEAKYRSENREKINAQCLALYHQKENRLHRPWELRDQLERAFRRVIEQKKRRQDSELARLKRAAKKAFTRRNWVQVKLARHLRRRFQKAFRYGNNFSAASQNLVGCSLSVLRQHLERQWQPGMSWENYGFYGWHIDHKKPCAKFNLTDPAQQRECFHYTNLQPLWAKENFAKRDKIT